MCVLATMSDYLLYECAHLLTADFNSPARQLHEKPCSRSMPGA